MRYFTIEQRETLDRRLNERAAELRRELDDGRADSAERAGGLDVGNDEAISGQLRQVNAALKRLHSPDFGICQDCGADIPYARLEAHPTAIRCRGCEALTERAHAPGVHAAL